MGEKIIQDSSMWPFELNVLSHQFELGDGPRLIQASVILNDFQKDPLGRPKLTEICESYELLFAQVSRLKTRLDLILELAKQRFEGPEPS